MNTTAPNQAPPIGDYALIADCHCAALVSRSGSIDWCCMPRFDAEPCFGRLLDWQRAGYCAVAPTAEFETSRRYLQDSMVLCTRFRTEGGVLDLFDLLVVTGLPDYSAHRQLLRIVEAAEGSVELEVAVQPRFAFGDVKPSAVFKIVDTVSSYAA